MPSLFCRAPARYSLLLCHSSVEPFCHLSSLVGVPAQGCFRWTNNNQGIAIKCSLVCGRALKKLFCHLPISKHGEQYQGRDRPAQERLSARPRPSGLSFPPEWDPLPFSPLSVTPVAISFCSLYPPWTFSPGKPGLLYILPLNFSCLPLTSSFTQR